MSPSLLTKQLVEQRDVIWGFLYALTRDGQAAEEVFQEVAVAILEEANRGTVVANFPAWAREIGRRRVAEYYRNKSAPRMQPLPASLEGVVSLAFEENASDGEHDSIQLEFLIECLQRLKGRGRELIEGFYRKKESLKELAARLGWQPGSVKVALSRTRKVLADCVKVKMNTSDARQL